MEDLHILCINCELLVLTGEISIHSQSCIIPSLASLELISTYGTNHIDFRLERLKNAMLSSVRQSFDKVLCQNYLYLIRQANEILSIKSMTADNLKICIQICLGLSQYSINQASTGLFLSLERLKLLCKEKSALISMSFCKSPQEKPQDFPYKASFLSINSITHSQNSLFSSHTSQSSLPNFSNPSIETEELTSEHLQKRDFYLKYLELKQEFPINSQLPHPSKLYLQAKDLNLPRSQFDSFIKLNFKSQKKMAGDNS